MEYIPTEEELDRVRRLYVRRQFWRKFFPVRVYQNWKARKEVLETAKQEE